MSWMQATYICRDFCDPIREVGVCRQTRLAEWSGASPLIPNSKCHLKLHFRYAIVFSGRRGDRSLRSLTVNATLSYTFVTRLCSLVGGETEGKRPFFCNVTHNLVLCYDGDPLFKPYISRFFLQCRYSLCMPHRLSFTTPQRYFLTRVRSRMDHWSFQPSRG